MKTTTKKPQSINHEHTEVLQIRLSPEHKKIIETQAEKAGLTVSQYIRGTMIMDAVLSGNPDAIKIAFSKATDEMKSTLRSMILTGSSESQIS